MCVKEKEQSLRLVTLTSSLSEAFFRVGLVCGSSYLFCPHCSERLQSGNTLGHVVTIDEVSLMQWSFNRLFRQYLNSETVMILQILWFTQASVH